MERHRRGPNTPAKLAGAAVFLLLMALACGFMARSGYQATHHGVGGYLTVTDCHRGRTTYTCDGSVRLDDGRTVRDVTLGDAGPEDVGARIRVVMGRPDAEFAWRPHSHDWIESIFGAVLCGVLAVLLAVDAIRKGVRGRVRKLREKPTWRDRYLSPQEIDERGKRTAYRWEEY